MGGKTKKGSFFNQSYFKLTKMTLSFIGQWPEQSPWTRRIIRLLIVSVMSTISVPELIKLFNVLDDLDTVVECIPPLGLHLLNVIKCITFANHMDQLLAVIKHMENDWKSRAGGDGSDILKSYAEHGRFLIVGYTYYMWVGATLYNCLPVVPFMLDIIHPLNETRTREFLFRAEYFFNEDDYPVPIFFHSWLTTMISMNIVIGCDAMFGACVHYVCAIFVELGEELESLQTIEDTYLSVDEKDDYTYHSMIKCVKKHKETIKFCDLMESTYTVYFLMVMGMNIFLISFTGVQTVMKISDFKLALRYSIFTLGEVVHAFYGCWHGQFLSDHSEQVIMAVYKSNWNEFSFRSRRLMMIMMMRSSEPYQLTAGKLFPVSLETFTTVMKTAMSYFTVLRSFQ